MTYKIIKKYRCMNSESKTIQSNDVYSYYVTAVDLAICRPKMHGLSIMYCFNTLYILVIHQRLQSSSQLRLCTLNIEYKAAMRLICIPDAC